MPRDPLVYFPAFRHHEKSREDANDAMMALLVGSQVSAQFLNLSSGSSKLLSEIFPAIAHIKRFDLRPDDAQRILGKAEQDLGAMAVPQALAIHESFILDCLKLVGVSFAKAYQMHDKLASKTNGLFDSELLTRFHVLREMRNSIIHRGGTANQNLVDAANDLTPEGEAQWRKHADRSPRGIQVGDRLTLMLGELILALATTKALAREANRLLISSVPSSTWAQVIIDDHLQETRKKLNPAKRRRTVLGLRRFHYSAIAVSESDLEAAAVVRGIPLV